MIRNDAVNPELKAIFEADQADRRDSKLSLERDRERLERVKQLLAEGAAVAGIDFFNAAMPFQHSSSRDDVWRAHELCLKAVELGYGKARWLAAAAYDRWLMYRQPVPFKN